MRTRKVAVGHQRPDAREAQLPTVRVSSENQVELIVGHSVEDSKIGRMSHTKAQDSRLHGAAAYVLVLVQSEVRIISTHNMYR